jgi:hypothetical protein
MLLSTVPDIVPKPIGRIWFQVRATSASLRARLYNLNSSNRLPEGIPVDEEYPPTLNGPAPLMFTEGSAIWFMKTPFLNVRNAVPV